VEVKATFVALKKSTQILEMLTGAVSIAASPIMKKTSVDREAALQFHPSRSEMSAVACHKVILRYIRTCYTAIEDTGSTDPSETRFP
jgi:hypothetical protein